MTTTEKPSTAAQRQYIYKLCGYDKLMKSEAVQWATGDPGKTSTKDLTNAQAHRLIEKLTGQTSNKPTVHPFGAFDATNPRHRKILSLCITYGWKTKKNGREIADTTHLGIWLESHPKAPVKKPLKKMDDTELSKTVYALEQLIKWKFK